VVSAIEGVADTTTIHDHDRPEVTEMTISDDEFHVLQARLKRLEDESALRELLSKYGLAADLDLRDEYRDLFTEDAFIDIAGRQPPGVFEGRDAILEQFFDGSQLRSMTGYCQHHAYSGPMVFHIDGDEAVAEGYSIVYVVSDREKRQVRAGHTFHQAIHVTSANINRWTFRRVDGRWKITGRVNRMLGDVEESRRVVARVLAGWDD